MPTIDMDICDTREYVTKALRNEAEPLWFPRLAEPLARVAWDRLQWELGLSPNSYSTTRVLLRDPKAEHLIAARCRPRSGEDQHADLEVVPVEILTADVVGQIADGDVRLLDTRSIAGTVADQLDAALSLLDLVPTVWPTVCQLVRALHVIDPGDNETDVSFSDPSVPFSVFVSVPPAPSETATLRVAEAILHEAMHLHLTLIAQVVPLVQLRGEMRYSPWRGDERDSEGILQALYVFSVIRSFLTMILMARPVEAGDYVSGRIQRIESQIRRASGFRECDELTPEGAALVTRLLYIYE